jgi:hypothetical protein
MSSVRLAADSTITTPLPKPATPESKLKAVIEQGLRELLDARPIDRKQEDAWSLDIEIDLKSIQRCAQCLKEQDARIPDSTNNDTSDFF